MTGTDTAGNLTTLAGSITVDTAAPAFAGGLSSTSDSGGLNNDNITNDNTPAFNGTGEVGAAVVLTIGGQTYATTVVAGGTWSVTASTPLTDGNKSYSITSTDIAGNVSTLSGNITVDTVSPTFAGGLNTASDTGISATDRITKVNTPQFSGTGEVGTAVALTIGGETYTTTVGAGGTWSINVSIPLTDGNKGYSLIGTDTAGNLTTLTGSITVDTAAPVLTGGLSSASDSGSSASDRITKVNTPQFSGTGEVGAAVALTIGGQTYNTTVGAGGTWSINVTNSLADGNQNYTLTGTDTGGNVTTLSSSIAVDTAAPVLIGGLSSATDTGSSAADRITKINTPQFSGTGEVGAAVALTIGGQTYNTTVGAGGAWSIEVATPLTDGNRSYTLTGTDTAGNLTTLAGSITVDTSTTVTARLAAASDSGVANNDDITNDNTPSFNGTGEVGAAVALVIGGQTYNTTVGAGGTWAIDVNNALADGSYSYSVTSTDIAGNMNTAGGSIIVDTVLPAFAGDLSVASDSGSSATDKITKINTPQFNGTGEVGAAVALTIGGQIYNTTVGAGGTWSINVSTPLTDGNKPYTLTGTDLAGNISSLGGSITVDTTNSVTARLSAASDSGVANNDNITNDNTPSFNGTGEVGAAVHLTIGGQTYSTTVGAGGTWVIDAGSALSNGNYAYTVTSTDSAGNVSTASGSITVDTVAPVLTGGLSTVSDSGSSAADRITKVNTPSFNGTGEVGAAVALTIGGQTYNTTVGAGGTWSINVSNTLTDGNQNYTLTGTDTAGNVTTLTNSITVDTAAPAFAGGLSAASDSGSSAADRITKINTPQFSGAGEVGAAVALTIGSQTYTTTVGAGGTWSIDVTTPLAEGNRPYTLTATDTAGNVTTLTNSVTVDTSTAVTARLSVASDSGTLNNDNITNDNTPGFNGTGEVGAEVALTIGGQTYTTTVGAGGTWSIASVSTLANGNQSYSVTSTDIAGNTNTVSGNITVDTVAPAFAGGLSASSDSGISAADRITKINTPHFSGTGEVGTAVVLTIGEQTYTTTVGAGGTWSVTASTPLSEGNKPYTITGTDLAGNQTSLSGSITVDTTAPVLTGGLSTASDTGSSATDRVTKVTTPQFTGTGETGAAVALTLGGQTYNTTVDSGGTWSINVTTPLTHGNKPYTLTGTDAAGNITTLSNNIVVDVQVAAPVARLEASKDTGASNSDSVTKNNLPAFSGTAEAGASIFLTINGQQLTASANGAGNWSIQTPTPFTDGNYAYSVFQIDPSGNQSAEATGSITIDTVPIVLSNIVLLDAGNNQMTNWVSNQPDNLTLQGSTEPNGTVTVLISGRPPAVVTANGSGLFTYDMPDLNDSNYTITVSVPDDLAGNSNSFSRNFLVDKTVSLTGNLDALYDTGSSQNDKITNVNTPLFSGASDPNATVTIKINGVQVGVVTASPSGTWQYLHTSPLADGTYTYEFSAVDTLGNSTQALGTNVTGAIVIDTSAPVFTAQLSPDSDTGTQGDKITNDRELIYRGLGEAGSTITLQLDGKTITTQVSQNGTWSITTSTLNFGQHAVTLTATDVAGNTRTITDQVTILVDFVQLAANLREVSDTATKGDGITSNTAPFLDGIATPTSTITVEIRNSSNVLIGTKTAQTDFEGKWSVQLQPDGQATLGDGEYTYKVTAVRDADTQVLTKTVVIDTVASTLTHALSNSTDSGTKGDTITNSVIPEIIGKTEPNASLTLNIAGKVFTTKADLAGDYSFALTSIPDGTHTYTVTVSDPAGNVSGYIQGGNTQSNNAATGTITLDRQAPIVTANLLGSSDSGMSSTDGITSDNTPTFTGTISGQFSEFYLTINNVNYNITPAGNGSWTLTLPALNDGAYNYAVVARDLSDNLVVLQKNIQIKTDIEFTTQLDNDTGTRDDDFLTNDNTLSFNGQTEPGNRIVGTLFNAAGTVQLGQVEVTSNLSGAYNLAFLNVLANGSYKVTFNVSDAAGNTFYLEETVIVDTVGQPLTFQMNSAIDTGENTSDGITKEKDVGFNGTGEPGSIVELTLLNSSGATVLNEVATVNSNGILTFQFSNLADGNYTIRSVASDNAGNSIAVADYNFQIITAAPVLTWRILEDANNDAIVGETELNGGRLTFDGTGNAGHTITVLIGGQEYITTVTGAGTWRITTPPLPDFKYPFQITAEDVAGNTTVVNSQVIQDSGLQVVLELQTDSFYSYDEYTNINQPIYRITTEAGADVQLTLTGPNGYSYSTSFKQPSVVYDWTLPHTLADGSYSISVRVQDQGLNVRTVNQSLRIDTVVSPQAEIEIPNSTVDGNGVYKVSDSRVFIEGPVNWDVDRVYVSVNNGQFTQNDYDLWGQNTRFSVPLTLPNGLHNVQVTFVDGAGNHLVKNYQIDVKDGFSIQPTVEIEDFNTHSGIWYGNPENLILSGQADPGLVMAIEIDGNELTTVVGPSGNWSIDLTGLDLLDGPHILSVSTADQYGNQFSGNYTLIADSTPPTSTFVANSDLDPSADQVLLNQKTATIQGQASRHDQVEVKLNGTLVYQTTVGTGGLWSYNLQHLTEGQNNLLVTIIDRAGNQSVLSKSINVDTTAPAPSVAGLSAASDTGSSNSDRITKTSTPQFAGTGEIGATVTLQINGNSFTNTLTTVVDQTGNWLINIQTPLADGAYTYNVSIADVAGNSTPIATNQSLVIDNQISGMSDGLTDATDTGLSNNDFITNNNTPVFEGTGNAGDTVLLTFSSLADQFTATVNQDGQWSISLAGTPLADGEYTYTLTSSDTAGNQLDLVTSGYLKVDTQAMASAGTSSFTTSDTTPQFTGTLSAEEEGARVDVSINGTIDTYTTWVDSGGNWSLEASTPVAVGDYTYEVTVTDVAGNTHSEQNDLHIV